jgi:23S rRNA pseudouridine2605 synthase
VFLNSDLPMGRWREMSQYEVDVLSAEVGLTPVAQPQMNAKTKDKMERLQRQSSRPLGKGERVRTLRPAVAAPTGERPSRQPQVTGSERDRPRSESGGQRPVAPGRAPRPSSRSDATGDTKRPLRGRSEGAERPARKPREDGASAPRTPRGDSAERSPRAPRGDSPRSPRPANGGRSDSRGTPVAERPSDVSKRPGKPKQQRAGITLVDDKPSGKRNGPPAGSGQRPGFGRRKPQ